MTKTLCMNCGKSPAKRSCSEGDQRALCPQCCAMIRNEQCRGCRYYQAAESYRAGKNREKHFVTKLVPFLEDECDKALALVERGRLREGDARLKDLFKHHPDYHTVQYGLGVIAAQRQDFEGASKYFRRAVEIFPHFTEAHFNLGMAYLKLMEIPAMIASFREVIRVGDDPELTAEAERVIKDFEENIRKYNGISLEAYLKNMETFKLGLQRLEAQDYEEAITLLKTVLTIDPNHHQSWGNLGLAYAGLGRKMKAVECLNRALEIDPEYEVALVNRAFIERLVEGEGINTEIQSVDYVKDYQIPKKKSYISDVIKRKRGK